MSVKEPRPFGHSSSRTFHTGNYGRHVEPAKHNSGHTPTACAAKTPQDLEVLLSDNHKSGLISAHAMLVGFGPVSVSWKVWSNE